MSSVDFLKVALAFKDETNYTAWSDLSSNLSSLSLLIQYTDFHSHFHSYLRTLFGTVTQRLGWEPKEGEGHLDALLRSLVLGRMGRAGDPATISEAKARFAAHCEGKKLISADLRTPVSPWTPLPTSFDPLVNDKIMLLTVHLPGVYHCSEQWRCRGV